MYAPLDKVGPKPDFNIRKNPEPDEELINSIKVHGILRSLDGWWKDSKKQFLYLADGHRRWRAAQILGFGSVPVKVLGTIPEREALLHSMAANEHQKKLSTKEQELGFKKLHYHGYTAEQISKAMCVELRRVTDAIKISTKAVPAVKKAAAKSVREGGIDKRVAGRVAEMNKKTQKELAPKLAGVPREKGLAIVRKAEVKAGIAKPGPKADDPPTKPFFAKDADERCRLFEKEINGMFKWTTMDKARIYARQALMMLQSLQGKISAADVLHSLNPSGKYHG